MQKLTDMTRRILQSRRFFYAVMVFFVFEALWIAFSARYPMAFDEDFHLGIIKIYSHHWFPFLSGQPDGANVYGAVAADPSYMYHYLMSYPYRLLTLITHSQTAQIIVLRVLNVGIFTAGIALFYRVLVRAGTSRALANTAVLLFSLVPIVPLTAGQINYDSLLLVAFAWLCSVVLTITRDLRERQRVRFVPLVLLVVIGFLGSLVKYPFLPLVAAAALYVVALLVAAYRGRWRDLVAAIKDGYTTTSWWSFGALAALVIVAAGLFFQRYGMNTLTYHTPLPSCSVVLGSDACSSYGPWARNHYFEATKGYVDRNPVSYTWTWLQALHYRSFFMIDGPPQYTNYPPSPLPSAAAIIIAVAGTVALAIYWRRVFMRNPYLAFIVLATLLYVGILWFDNYGQYLKTGQPVAINGRYLLPLLLPLAALLGRGLHVALKAWPSVKVWAAVVAIIFFTQGGGVFGFILRSNASWDWNNQTVVRMNRAARLIIDPVIFQGPKHYY